MKKVDLHKAQYRLVLITPQEAEGPHVYFWIRVSVVQNEALKDDKSDAYGHLVNELQNRVAFMDHMTAEKYHFAVVEKFETADDIKEVVGYFLKEKEDGRKLSDAVIDLT